MKIEKSRIFHHRDGDKELTLFEESLKEKDKMNDNKEFAVTNEGTDGIKQVPLETKEATLLKDKIGPEYVGLDKAHPNNDVTALTIVKKKRGRKPKVSVPPNQESGQKEFYCGTCKQVYAEQAVMKIHAGDNRYSIFCPDCQRSLGFFDLEFTKKMEKLLKHPNKK